MLCSVGQHRKAVWEPHNGNDQTTFNCVCCAGGKPVTWRAFAQTGPVSQEKNRFSLDNTHLIILPMSCWRHARERLLRYWDSSRDEVCLPSLGKSHLSSVSWDEHAQRGCKMSPIFDASKQCKPGCLTSVIYNSALSGREDVLICQDVFLIDLHTMFRGDLRVT